MGTSVPSASDVYGRTAAVASPTASWTARAPFIWRFTGLGALSPARK